MRQLETEDLGTPKGIDWAGQGPRRFRASVDAIEEFGAMSARPEDIPEAEPCYACGGPTVKASIDYETTYECNEASHVTATKGLPGYRCELCDAAYVDPGLDDRFLGIVAQSLAGLASPQLQDALERRDEDPHSFTIFTPTLPPVEEQP